MARLSARDPQPQIKSRLRSANSLGGAQTRCHSPLPSSRRKGTSADKARSGPKTGVEVLLACAVGES
eukprot:4851307-Pyramimonas_sp.AAC.1